jgi:hypothetical protein
MAAALGARSFTDPKLFAECVDAFLDGRNDCDDHPIYTETVNVSGIRVGKYFHYAFDYIVNAGFAQKDCSGAFTFKKREAVKLPVECTDSDYSQVMKTCIQIASHRHFGFLKQKPESKLRGALFPNWKDAVELLRIFATLPESKAHFAQLMKNEDAFDFQVASACAEARAAAEIARQRASLVKDSKTDV